MQQISNSMQFWQEKIEQGRQNWLRNQGQQLTLSEPEEPAKTYECLKCKDEGGFISVKIGSLRDWKSKQPKEYQYEAWTECECVKAKKLKHFMKSSNLSEEFLEKSFSNYSDWAKDDRMRSLARGARKYAMDFQEIRKKKTAGHSLGLCGAVGIGKTHLGSAVANYLMKQKIRVTYFNFVNGFKEMFAHYDNGGLEVQYIREGIQKCEVLFIDDIGKGRVNQATGVPEITKGVYDEMYALIEYRYFNNLPIIWTSEYELELVDMFGEATASRLLEMTGDNLFTAFYEDGEAAGSLNYRLRKFM